MDRASNLRLWLSDEELASTKARIKGRNAAPTGKRDLLIQKGSIIPDSLTPTPWLEFPKTLRIGAIIPCVARDYVCACGAEVFQPGGECDSCWAHNQAAQEAELAKAANSHALPTD